MTNRVNYNEMIYKSIDLHPYLGVRSKLGSEKSPHDLL